MAFAWVDICEVKEFWQLTQQLAKRIVVWVNQRRDRGPIIEKRELITRLRHPHPSPLSLLGLENDMREDTSTSKPLMTSCHRIQRSSFIIRQAKLWWVCTTISVRSLSLDCSCAYLTRTACKIDRILWLLHTIPAREAKTLVEHLWCTIFATPISNQLHRVGVVLWSHWSTV